MTRLDGKIKYQEAERAFAVRRLTPLDYMVILLFLVIMPSAILHSIIGIENKIIFAFLVPPIIIATVWSRRWLRNASEGVTIFLLTMNGLLASLVADSYSQALMGVTLSASLLCGYQLMLTLRTNQALKIASWVAFALLVGGVIGIIYSFLVREPLYEIKVEYRTSYLYLTTFSIAAIGDFVRPCGIFDEPGAFAMYVAIITMFNDTMRVNRHLNVVLVSLLVFTGSLVGILLIALYFVTSNAMRAVRFASIAVLFALTVSIGVADYIFPDNPLGKAVDTFYSERFQIVDGALVGDNRSNQVAEFFELVDANIILRGQKASGRDYYEQDQAANPFSIVFGYGLIISLPYFLLVMWLLTITIRSGFRNSYATLGLFVLLLQRPYIYHLSWSIMIAALVWLIYSSTARRRVC